ncbi:MAG: flagellar biosynthesis protein FlgF, partial [Deltaproteobacteria bacterium]|nr:flagellar biosynthesis protein FlgF [Deltaproteobacteria bacterium]
DQTNGALTQTGNPLDVAIDGDGYLAVDTPRGTRYTRDGALQLGPDGHLVTAGGLTVRGEGGPIVIPPGTAQIAVEPDGTVHADEAVVGKLELVHLDPKTETRDGDQLVASRTGPIAGPPPRLVSGVLEGSNVNVVRGVVDLVKVSRSYESLLKIIQGYHDIESRAAREIGGK